MSLKEIQEIIKLVSEKELAEFRLREGEFEITIRSRDYVEAKYSSTPTAIPTPTPVYAPAPILSGTPAAASAPAPMAAPAASGPANGENGKGKADEANYVAIKSPIVGTFYRSSSPEKPPFVKPGDSVSKGQTVCIVEAMKLFNEIESEVSGTIVKVMVEDAQPVEYDQVLFLVDPA